MYEINKMNYYMNVVIKNLISSTRMKNIQIDGKTFSQVYKSDIRQAMREINRWFERVGIDKEEKLKAIQNKFDEDYNRILRNKVEVDLILLDDKKIPSVFNNEKYKDDYMKIIYDCAASHDLVIKLFDSAKSTKLNFSLAYDIIKSDCLNQYNNAYHEMLKLRRKIQNDRIEYERENKKLIEEQKISKEKEETLQRQMDIVEKAFYRIIDNLDKEGYEVVIRKKENK